MSDAYTARTLPMAEYARLAATSLGPVVPLLPPDAQVVVIEDDGAIIGHLAVLPMWHAEAIYIAPAHRGKGRVFRLLAQALGRTVAALGITTVIAGADDDPMDDILRKLHAVPFPARLYYLNVQESPICRPS